MADERVLVTGSSGLLGTALVSHLAKDGWDVVPFDLQEDHDVLDPSALRRAMRGCRHVVHLAAVVDPDGDPADVMSVNVLGTWNVLQAAEEAGVWRVVHASSVNALGLFMGDGQPDYLPIDDDHPARPQSAYGMSKLLAERMCRAFTESTGIATVSLRFPAIWDEGTYAWIQDGRDNDAAFESSPIWEYGAFIDVRDAAHACLVGLNTEHPGHVRALVCAPDISTSGPTSREHAEQFLPDVPWRGGEAYDADPFRALLDTRVARDVLGFEPQHSWRRWCERRDHS